MQKMTIAVNDDGFRIGESHPRAVLTDAETEMVRRLHFVEGMSYGKIAQKFEISKSCVAHIITGYRRGQTGIKVERALGRD